MEGDLQALYLTKMMVDDPLRFPVNVIVDDDVGELIGSLLFRSCVSSTFEKKIRGHYFLTRTGEV